MERLKILTNVDTRIPYDQTSKVKNIINRLKP